MALAAKKVRVQDTDHKRARASDANEGWPPEVEGVVRLAVEQLQAGAISDQQSFEKLVAVGIPERQAKAILSTVLATAVI